MNVAWSGRVSIVWVNQTLEEVCLKEDLCPLRLPHFLSFPSANILVVDDCPNVKNKLLIVELFDWNKHVHHKLARFSKRPFPPPQPGGESCQPVCLCPLIKRVITHLKMPTHWLDLILHAVPSVSSRVGFSRAECRLSWRAARLSQHIEPDLRCVKSESHCTVSCLFFSISLKSGQLLPSFLNLLLPLQLYCCYVHLELC